MSNTTSNNNDVSNTETETSITGAFPNERSSSGYDGTAGITHFNAEAEVVEASPQKPITLQSDLNTSPQTTIGQADIKAFLSLPYIIQSGILTNGDTATIFPTIECPFDLFNGNPIWKNKLQGIFAMRFTMVFTIVVNATRFQQGRYILNWTPTCGHTGTNDNNIAYFNMHNATISQVVQTPHVEFDLNCDTTATLRIPFVSTMSHYPMLSAYSTDATRYGELGFVRLYPYQKLLSVVGQINASYTLWVHLEDVDLEGRWYAQAKGGKIKGLDSTSSEQEDGNIGPIGRTFGQISRAAHIIGQTPGLSTYATPVSWAADLAKRVSYVFGWSRPNNLQPIQRVQNNSLGYWMTSDMPDNSLPLSLFGRNQVEVLPGFGGTDRDEMSIDYLKSIPSYITTVDWTIGHIAGTQIATFDLNPSFLRYGNIPFGGHTLMNHSTISWLASHFQYYRGGLVFKFKFVKTEFHSGRIAIIWQPGDDNYKTPINPTLPESQLTHREIIDLRYSNEATITIPYVSPTHYKNCGPTGTTGYLLIRVLDQLRAPATVFDAVQILVEVAGAPDMEFAFPIANKDYMVAPLQPQMADIDSNPCTTENVVIGNGVSKPHTDIFSRVCIGEKIDNLRSLLKKADGRLINSIQPVRNFAPYMTQLGQIVAAIPGPFNLDAPDMFDFYDQCQSIFAMSRGGVRIKAYNGLARAGIPVTASLFNFEFTHGIPNGHTFASATTWYGFTAAQDQAYNSLRLQVVNDQTTNFATEVQIPQYHFLHSRNSCSHTAIRFVPHTFYQNLATRLGVSMVFHAPSNTIVTSRSGSDDCNFSHFVSIPPVKEVYTNAV